MKTAEKTSVLEFLSRVKEILDSKGETRFEELGKKTRIAIVKLFQEYFDYEEDGDSDYCYRSASFKGISLTMTSNADYDYDFDDDPCDLWVDADDQYYDISEMIDAVTKVIPTDETIALLNTSIITADGDYRLSSISLSRALEILDGAIIDSAIGHDATAQIMSDLLDVDVPVNRQMFSQNVGQRAIVFKLHGRPQEGKILNRDEIEAIGYDFKVLTRLS